MSSLHPQAFNNLVPLNKKDSRTIVFIDSSIANWEDIAQKVVFTARVIIIGSEDDGVKEISRFLNASNCLEIHIFSSGFPGCIYLGKSELSLDTFHTYYLLIKRWFKGNNWLKLGNFTRHIYIYSSNLNIGDSGEEFIAKLGHIAEAKIFISSDFTNSNVLVDSK